MKKIEYDRFVEIYFDEKTNLVEYKWLPATEHSTKEQAMESFQLVMKTIASTMPRLVLNNGKDFRNLISVENQKLIAEITINTLDQIGVEKLVVVSPQEILAGLSSKQTADEARELLIGKSIIFETFTSYDEAKDWLIL